MLGLFRARAAPVYENPILPDDLADPAVLRHDGVYYLYATGEVNGDNGTRVRPGGGAVAEGDLAQNDAGTQGLLGGVVGGLARGMFD